LIQALVDKPCGGISIDECASINKGLYALLEKKGIIDRAFTIEIFSPGLDRPLRSRKDFLRTTGKDVRFFLLEPVNGKIELEGTIISVGEETVGVKAGENVIEVPLEKIRMGKQVY
jgi:ribosome maturation factor RimP